ncbi:type II secretion system protein [Candidatus Dojkabacteria bacterium]|nr:type II secretion system protein [Candidatus Dojkabacteria bacterium]
MFKFKSYKAFTLVEMLVVMGILVILMTMGIFAGRFAIQRANRVQHQSAADQIYQGLQSYYADNREYPSSVDFDSFDSALSSTGVLGKYVDSSSFDGGSDATYYYAVDDTGQSTLVCVSFGGVDDENDLGGYCNGNGFGILPIGGTTVSKKELTADEFDAAVASGFISGDWGASGEGWN